MFHPWMQSTFLAYSAKTKAPGGQNALGAKHPWGELTKGWKVYKSSTQCSVKVGPEVKWYAPVWHTDTSLVHLKSHHRFFLADCHTDMKIIKTYIQLCFLGAKYARMCLQSGLRPGPHLRSLRVPQTIHYLDLRGLLLRGGKDGRGRRERGRERKREANKNVMQGEKMGREERRKRKGEGKWREGKGRGVKRGQGKGKDHTGTSFPPLPASVKSTVSYIWFSFYY